jgi:hypothetical protein
MTELADAGPTSRHQRFQAIMDAAAGASTANYMNHPRFWTLPLQQLKDFELYGIPMMRPAGGAELCALP